mgnify:CR=1 FL=1
MVQFKNARLRFETGSQNQAAQSNEANPSGWLFCFPKSSKVQRIDLAQAALPRLRAVVAGFAYDEGKPRQEPWQVSQGHSPGGKPSLSETVMHPSTNTMLIIIVTGVALMLVGFGLRDRNIGMGLMGVGLITAIGTIIYKAYITFY